MSAAAIVLAFAWSSAALAGGAQQDDLVHLIELRLGLMKDVAAYKFINDIAIEDKEREAVVLARAIAEAEVAGLDGATMAPFFSAQIDAAKMIQQCWFERWQNGDAAEPDEAPDLQGELRPRLIDIGDALIQAIAVSLSADEGLLLDAAPAIDCMAPASGNAIVNTLYAAALAP